MFFPAGIPFVAVVALIVWNARQEAAHTQQAPSSAPRKP
jgi:hypothetical protein